MNPGREWATGGCHYIRIMSSNLVVGGQLRGYLGIQLGGLLEDIINPGMGGNWGMLSTLVEGYLRVYSILLGSCLELSLDIFHYR